MLPKDLRDEAVAHERELCAMLADTYNLKLHRRALQEHDVEIRRWYSEMAQVASGIAAQIIARTPAPEPMPHACPQCGASNPEHDQLDGCRDPHCPEQG